MTTDAPPSGHDPCLDAMREQMARLEKFIARRFDELSMEINATAQQLDMAEQDISTRFGDIMKTLSAVSYSGSGDTMANAGVELEAVVAHTEQAANKIMDAADRINRRFYTRDDWADPQTRFHMIEDSKRDLQQILLACSFQDLVSQRIRKTLEQLNLVEERLSSTLTELGIPIQMTETNPAELVQASRGATQAEIDALFN